MKYLQVDFYYLKFCYFNSSIVSLNFSSSFFERLEEQPSVAPSSLIYLLAPFYRMNYIKSTLWYLGGWETSTNTSYIYSGRILCSKRKKIVAQLLRLNKLTLSLVIYVHDWYLEGGGFKPIGQSMSQLLVNWRSGFLVMYNVLYKGLLVFLFAGFFSRDPKKKKTVTNPSLSA